MTTNRRGGVKVIMADTFQKRGTLSLKKQSVNLFKSKAASKAAQILNNLFIKAPQQLNTIFIPFYKMSFAIYSFLDKTPFIRAPILYGFVL